MNILIHYSFPVTLIVHKLFNMVISRDVKISILLFFFFRNEIRFFIQSYSYSFEIKFSDLI